MKTCFRCGDPKPASQFQRDSKTKDKLRSSCRECTNEGRREKNKHPLNELKKIRDIAKKMGKIPPIIIPNFEAITEPHNIDVGSATSVDFFPEGVEYTDAQALHSIFQKISDHHAAPLSISFYKNGKYRIQTHGNPAHTWNGTIEEILPKAMR